MPGSLPPVGCDSHAGWHGAHSYDPATIVTRPAAPSAGVRSRYMCEPLAARTQRGCVVVVPVVGAVVVGGTAELNTPNRTRIRITTRITPIPPPMRHVGSAVVP